MKGLSMLIVVSAILSVITLVSWSKLHLSWNGQCPRNAPWRHSFGASGKICFKSVMPHTFANSFIWNLSGSAAVIFDLITACTGILLPSYLSVFCFFGEPCSVDFSVLSVASCPCLRLFLPLLVLLCPKPNHRLSSSLTLFKRSTTNKLLHCCRIDENNVSTPVSFNKMSPALVIKYN